MKKIFLDLDGTLANFNVENALQRFDNEKGFFANLQPYNNIEIVNQLANNGNLYIISASPNLDADNDKMTWISQYLFNIPNENILICRVGENKAKYIFDKLKIKIDNTCFLLDDYTKNLQEWEQQGGIGIKRLTDVSDNKSKKWRGLTLSDLLELGNIA